MPTGYMNASGPMRSSVGDGIGTGPSQGTPYGLNWGSQGLPNFQQGLSRDLVGRTQREQGITGAYDKALLDPTGTADLFGKYFQQAAQGYAAPLMQQFQGDLSNTAGNVASRFGGNASSEEMRASSNAGNIFSRNLTNALAQLAPQQVAAGQAYTGMLGNAQSQAASQSDLLKELLQGGLQSIYQPKKKFNLGSALGTIGGSLLGGGPLSGLFGGGGGGGSGDNYGSDFLNTWGDMGTQDTPLPYGLN